MSGELLEMARSGITLLPGEAAKVAAAYDKMRADRDHLRSILAALRKPSQSITMAATQAYHDNYHHDDDGQTPLGWAIRAAVAAAEQEVRRA